MDLIVFEDEHILVVDKPSGWNTHAPSPYANEGLYEWLKHREAHWRNLAILHRLDKETSGLIVFGKTPEANRSLTQQFENREVAKKYILMTDRPSERKEFTVKSNLQRTGETYSSQPDGRGGQPAETHFQFISTDASGHFVWQAEPLTGRTHQIRVHASEQGIPILGDALYRGFPGPRLCLHAAELAFKHPIDGRQLNFRVPAKFEEPTFARLRSAIVQPEETDVYRLVHGAADGWPNLYVERWGDFLLTSSPHTLTPSQLDFVRRLSARGVYGKRLTRQPGRESAQLLFGAAAASDEVSVREHRLAFKIRFEEGYSVGLFLDQRENRRRLLTGHISVDLDLPTTGETLNVFAYTCAFSVCAAKRGKVTSIDLSRKYLAWGRENFALNHLPAEDHEFLEGEAFDWLARLTKKKRAFDLILLDPPTFSRSKEGGVFQAAKDYGRLVSAALPLLRPGGILFASTNAAAYKPEAFLSDVTQSIQQSGRQIARRHYGPQPPDFPIHASEPAYLKTLWAEVC